MAENRSPKSSGLVPDLQCYFYSRGPSTYEGFDWLSLRVPSVRDPDDRREFFAAEARKEIVRLHLASAGGILEAVGATDLANEVGRVMTEILKRLGEKHDDQDTEPNG